MATPLYFRQYHDKPWSELDASEREALLRQADEELAQAGQRRNPHYGERPVGVSALPGGYTYMWGVLPVDKA